VNCPELCSSASSILELGAGTGLVGLTAAMLACDDPSRVMLTDNNERVLELVQRNIDINFAFTRRELSRGLFVIGIFVNYVRV